MRAKYTYLIILIASLALTTGCKPYKEHLMLKADDDYTYADFQKAAQEFERNYVIQVNDQISLEVYTNDGERIIDPDYALLKEMPSNQVNSRPNPSYLVREDGFVKLPLLGDVKLTGMTLNEANLYLQERFNVYYNDSYVEVQFDNKRVIVLGAMGGQLLPLENQNVSVAEIISMGGGLQLGGKSHNIRLIRENEIYLINLSTVDGFLETNMIVQPNDIIYIEPIQKIASEVARDITPWVALITSFTTLILVIVNQ